MAAIPVTVAGAVNGWWKRQSKSLDEYKKERCAKVIKDGVEKVEETAMGDITSLEPCDGDEIVSQACAAVGKRKRRKKPMVILIACWIGMMHLKNLSHILSEFFRLKKPAMLPQRAGLNEA